MKKPREMPVQTLRQLLRYEPETGELFWRERPVEMFEATGGRTASHAAANWNSRYSQKPALFSDNGKGYKHGSIFDQKHFAHRVVWALHFGYWPKGDVDHINGNRADNRIENLRAVTRSENLCNAKRSKRNTSGVTGVFWDKTYSKWDAQIFIRGQRIHLGFFDDFAAAVAARKTAEARYGFHPNHGRAA